MLDDKPADADETLLPIKNSDDEVWSRIAGIVATHFKLNPSDVTPQTRFADLRADSIEIANVCMQLEDEFDVIIQEDAKFETVGDFQKVLTKLLAGQTRK